MIGIVVRVRCGSGREGLYSVNNNSYNNDYDEKRESWLAKQE